MPEVLEVSELLVPGPADALNSLLELGDRADPETLPPMWHLVYLLEHRRQSELGPDGHPRTGIPSPPAPGQSRMYAGGSTVMHRPLRCGVPATRRSWVDSQIEKAGRSGPLVFATVRHEFSQQDQLAIVEEHNIVYRTPSTDAAASRPAEPEPAVPTLRFPVDPVLLFRFSALTYNGHRIHYDRPYAAEEGYPDLVIHGPLQVLLMAEAFRQAGLDLCGRRFDYRLTAPVFGAQTLAVGLSSGAAGEDASDLLSSAWVRDCEGRATARAQLSTLDMKERSR